MLTDFEGFMNMLRERQDRKKEIQRDNYTAV